jgi:enterochelin esterase-like enzyme
VAQVPVARSSGVNALVQLVTLLLIWLAIKTRFMVPRREHLRYWMAVPAMMAIGVLATLPADPSPQFPGLAPAPIAETEARERVARVFGTPVPRVKPDQRAQEAARIGITPVPLPPPPPPVAAERAREARPEVPPPPAPSSTLSDYVGPIRGTLREYFFYSPALDRDMSYYIYLPPDYGTAGRRYPVMYMLHGGGGDKDEWPAYGLVDTVDQLIDTKQIRPLMLVLPQGDYGYWVNHVENGPRWGDYVSFDLVRHVDSSFRTLPDPEHRGVAGLSMGGYGALLLGFTNPHVFRVIGAHSPSLRAEEELEDLATILGNGDEFARRDVMQIAKIARNLDVLQIWIDLGEDDPWLERANSLHELLDQRGIEHEFHMLPGDHSGDYWQANLVTYATFYDRTLNWAYK